MKLYELIKEDVMHDAQKACDNLNSLFSKFGCDTVFEPRKVGNSIVISDQKGAVLRFDTASDPIRVSVWAPGNYDTLAFMLHGNFSEPFCVKLRRIIEYAYGNPVTYERKEDVLGSAGYIKYEFGHPISFAQEENLKRLRNALICIANYQGL